MCCVHVYVSFVTARLNLSYGLFAESVILRMVYSTLLFEPKRLFVSLFIVFFFLLSFGFVILLCELTDYWT